jgi:hypothetical protein
MEEIINRLSQTDQKGISAGILYTVLLLAIGAYLNYVMPYDGSMEDNGLAAQHQLHQTLRLRRCAGEPNRWAVPRKSFSTL